MERENRNGAIITTDGGKTREIIIII